jgi:hypothetical protein
MSQRRLLKRIAILAVLAGSLMIQGCITRVPISPHPARPAPIPHEVIFDLSLSVEPVRVTLGDPVTLEIHVHNPYPHHVEMHFHSGCNVDFQVSNSEGRSVGPFRACNAFRSSIGLDGHETRVIRREWPAQGDYYRTPPTVLPGRYWITAGFRRGVKYEAVTDAVMIEIVSPVKDE